VTGPSSAASDAYTAVYIAPPMACSGSMLEVKRTDAFDSWLKVLKDSKGRAMIQARIDPFGQWEPGDVGPIGEGLSELRIDFGPGYRVYYARAGRTLYLLLCGGDKGSEDADIKNAHATWRELNPPAKKE
jgi:putative addiction module killer protein